MRLTLSFLVIFTGAVFAQKYTLYSETLNAENTASWTLEGATAASDGITMSIAGGEPVGEYGSAITPALPALPPGTYGRYRILFTHTSSASLRVYTSANGSDYELATTATGSQCNLPTGTTCASLPEGTRYIKYVCAKTSASSAVRSCNLSSVTIEETLAYKVQANTALWYKDAEDSYYSLDSTMRNSSHKLLLNSESFRYVYNVNGRQTIGSLERIPYNIDNKGSQDFYVKNYLLANRGVQVFLNQYATGTEISGYDSERSFIGPVDYNQDGLTDFLYSDFVMQQAADGTFKRVNLSVMTMEQYEDLRSETAYGTLSASYLVAQNFAGLKKLIANSQLLMCKACKISLATDNASSSLMAFDFNGDGLIDILNAETGVLMLNMGNGTYATTELGGTMAFRDLNGDGLLDYVIYDGSKVYVGIAKSDGSFTTKEVYTNPSLDNIWFTDFDSDGDVDIVLSIDYTAANQYAYLVFVRNDGDGVFTSLGARSYAPATHGELYFRQLVDLDGDGIQDVLAVDELGKIVWLKGGSQNFVLQAAPIYESTSISYAISVSAADIDGDGFYEILIGSAISKIIPFNGVAPTAVQSVEAAKPAAPSFVFDQSGGYLKVSWNPGSHPKYSAADLSYELCIGRTGYDCEIYGANADPITAKRHNFLNGNMGYSRDVLLDVNAWNPGDYYIKIQVIDPNKNGSEWSAPAVFAKTVLPASFVISGGRNVIDNLELSLTAPYNSALTYHWNFGGATVVTDGNENKIINFSTPGYKNITLQTEQGGVLSRLFEQEVFIAGNKFTTDENPSIGNNVYAYADLQANGKLMALTGDKLYENDGNGKFTKVAGAYQTTISFGGSDIITDYNSDGLPDILQYDNNKLTVYESAVNGFGEFDIITRSIDLPWPYSSYSYFIADLDGNGKMDIVRYDSIYINKGDYKEYTAVPYKGAGPLAAIDFDNDGKMDIVSYTQEGRINAYTYRLWLSKGNGDGSFADTVEIELPNILGFNQSYIKFADMDGDGYPDAIGYSEVQKAIYIFYNNAGKGFRQSFKEIKFKDGVGYDPIGFAYDFDNNGYLDLFVTTGCGSGARYCKPKILYFDSEANYVEVDAPDFRWGNPMADLNGDGVEDIGNHINYINNSTVANAAPAAPSNIRHALTDSTLIIEWDAATDAETPSSMLRYNVSVKKKGATGANSYVISPLNATKNGILPVSGGASEKYNPYYRKSTRMEIPLEQLTLGSEYDIQIQTLDLWNKASDFSPAVTAKVSGSPIRIPSSICANTPATVRYAGTETAPVWNWDGATATKIGSTGNNYSATWATEGAKTISADGASVDLVVLPPINTLVDIPSMALPNAEIEFTLPGEGLLNYTWDVMMPERFSNNWGALSGFSNFIQIYRKNSNLATAYVVFKVPDVYKIRLNVKMPCGTASAIYETQVIDAPPAQISLVTAENGKAKINWKLAGLPSVIKKVNIYREGSKYNSFERIASVPVEDGYYIDPVSNTNITTNRYRIAYAGENAKMEGERSTIHKNLHLMINKGIGNAWNLYWGAYEGAIVESFYVLRGTSPDNLEILSDISGSTASFSDIAPPTGGEVFYAIGYDTPWQPDIIIPMAAPYEGPYLSAPPPNLPIGSTNVVGTQTAFSTVLATSITIGDIATLTPEHSFEVLSAIVEPQAATYKGVHWRIVTADDEDEVATIQNGVLAMNPSTVGSGTITIKAEAIDGSGKSATKTVSYSGMTGIQSSNNRGFDDGVSSSSSGNSGTGGSSSSSEDAPSSSSVETSSSSSEGIQITPSSSSSEDTPSSSSNGIVTPTQLPQIAQSNQATQIYNGINLHATHNATIDVYALNGRGVSQYTLAGGVHNVSLGHLPKGVYIVKVSFGSEKRMLRVPVR